MFVCNPDKELQTKRIRVYGIVQGVGFRPTVSRHATAAGITGSVCNKGPYVEIFAQGTKEQVEHFLHRLKKEPPRRAAILKIDVKEVEEKAFSGFLIIESEKESGEIFISPDIAICEECKEELFDPENPRYLHPFINCTCCGPRLTILDALPYDRVRTSMKKFPMCPSCEAEYYDPATRRYDAQPVCCPNCGPQVYLIGREERGKEAITEARRIISEGGIIAVKGIGGFHLCCDATNEQAIRRLREKKSRPMKPFAVMMRDVDTVRRECEISEENLKILDGHQKPILLLPKKEGAQVPDICAPDNRKLGVMLPYAPVQLLLFRYDDDIRMSDCLVMTSGNESGAPICRDDADAVKSLGHLCDAILSNDRDIRVRADDTVMDLFEGEPYMIRRSRGYAPLPFMVDTDGTEDEAGVEAEQTEAENEKVKNTDQRETKTVLGIGGELKNSFTIGTNGLYYQSPYIGDLADLRTVDAMKETIGRMQHLLEVKADVIACDLHPRYQSVEVARELAEEMEVPLLSLQHHYAHVLSCMAENSYTEPVIGISYDGTGYGTDGTIWGGEILYADVHGFERTASIDPFLQIGGDLSAKEGWRIAAAIISEQAESYEDAWKTVHLLDLCDEQTFKVQYQMARRKLNAVVSTSAGRLFDAVSAVLGIRTRSTFEGEASMALQYHAERYLERTKAEATLQSEPGEGILMEHASQNAWEEDAFRKEFSTAELFFALLQRKLSGEDSDLLAYRFHQGLALYTVRICEQVREEKECRVVALSGGVFQNTLLLKLCKDALEEKEFRVLIHRMIPPNDGGISIGQALYAAYNRE